MRSSWTQFAKFSAAAATLAAGLSILTGGLSAQGPPSARDVVNGHEAAPNEVLVKFRVPQSAGDRAQTAGLLDADRDDDLTPGVRHIHSRRFDAATLVNFFQGAPNVEYAEPNYILSAIKTPNDPSFGSLWGLLNTGQVINGQAGVPGADIKAVPAWDITTGSTANVVGVVDTGTEYTHPDLAANMWSAPAQFTVNIFGTNFTCPAGSHGFQSIGGFWSCTPLDDNNHGSHTSGTIGAVGNNGVGVAGVNWTASIMALKFLNSQGSGSTVDAVYTIEFAIQAKAVLGANANVRILSNSWGCAGCFDQTLKDEIDKAGANDILFVAAAGNNGTNNDTSPFYPASYTSTNLIAVAATDNQDNKASFSNYGATTVDLGAPGVNIYSTIRVTAGSYAFFSGTSMATPHVAGAAALILSACTLDTAGLKSLILGSVDPIAALAGKTVTGGRLNVNTALTSCANPPPPPPDPPTNLTATAGIEQVILNWTGSAGATSYTIKRSTVSGGPYTNAGTTANTSFTNTGLTAGVTYYFVVTASNGPSESANSNEAFATPSAPPPPPPPTGLTATAGNQQVSLQWNAAAGATSYTIKRSTVSGGPYTSVGTTAATSFTNTGLTNGITYYYVVTASNGGGESGNSNEAFATPTGPVAPPAPTNLTASAGPGKKQIRLNWSASAGATSYNVKRSSTSGGPYTVIATVTGTSYTNNGLQNNTRYYYVVSAVNAGGESPNSNEATAKTF